MAYRRGSASGLDVPTSKTTDSRLSEEKWATVTEPFRLNNRRLFLAGSLAAGIEVTWNVQQTTQRPASPP